MYEHEGVNDMNKDIERTANIDPLLHDAMPMENDAWSMNSKGLNLACGETYINAETIDARDLSTSGRFGDADDASTYGADVTDARIMSPKSFTTSIKEAIHGTGSKTSVRNFHFKENDLNSNVSGNCYMSSNISNFTDAFQAIASQQKVLSASIDFKMLISFYIYRCWRSN